MIIFLYGEDSYGIRQKMKELIAGYRVKNPSGFNMASVDFSEDGTDRFFEAVKSESLIPEKKLIILKNIFKADAGAVLDFLKKMELARSPEVYLIAEAAGNFSGKGELAGEKKKLFDYLTAKPNLREHFKLLNAYEVKNWAKKYANYLGIEMAGDALDYLVLSCGADRWRLDGELKKMANFKIKGVISRAQAEELVIPSANANVFEITDALARKDKKRAAAALHRAIENGESPIEILGLLAWQIRNLLKYKTSARPADLKLHPFVLGKLKEAAGFFTEAELAASLSKIMSLDLELKTGNVNEKAALALIIAEM